MYPDISVVIPLYNKAPHIANTLESVIAQARQPLEIIVVDDGSTDGGGEVVESLNNPSIRVIRQVNRGVSSARNVGVQAAQSNYICFLDADDFWHSDHLLTICSLIGKYPDIGLFSSLYEINHGGYKIFPRSAYPSGFSGIVDDFFSRFSFGLSLVNSSTACVCREAFLAAGGFPEGVKRGEDVILWIKLAQSHRMAHASKITAIYNRDAVNRSSQLRESEVPGSLLFLTELMRTTANANELKSIKLLFSRVAFFTAAGFRELGDLTGVLSIRALCGRISMWRLYFLISLLLITPSVLLTHGRKWRHRSG